MDTKAEAAKAAREIRIEVQHGTVTRPKEPTKEEVWGELEKRFGEVIKPHLDDAYAAGKADGLRAATAKNREKED